MIRLVAINQFGYRTYCMYVIQALPRGEDCSITQYCSIIECQERGTQNIVAIQHSSSTHPAMSSEYVLTQAECLLISMPCSSWLCRNVHTYTLHKLKQESRTVKNLVKVYMLLVWYIVICFSVQGLVLMSCYQVLVLHSTPRASCRASRYSYRSCFIRTCYSYKIVRVISYTLS